MASWKAFTCSTRRSADPYLAFLGRISPEKGPDRVIFIAKRLGTRLKIAAKVDAADVCNFRDEIEPLLARSPNRIHREEIGPNHLVWC
jgi:glycosyltransferase involved in cell wall biosynthesis